MAASSDECFRSKLRDDMLTCHICDEVYTTPKLLSCQHSFCEDCLEKWVQAPPKGQLSCPDCRKVVESFDGVENLPNNIFLGNLFDMIFNNPLNPGIDAVLQSCDVCKPGVPGNKPENRCLDCDQYLCLKCSKVHHKINVTKNHTLMSVEKYEKTRLTNPSIERNYVYCDKHTGSKVDIYCKTCDVAVCVNCAFGEHPNPEHQYTSLDMAAKSEVERFVKLVERLSDRTNELKAAKTHVENQLGELSNSFTASLKLIKKHAVTIHQNVEARERMATESLLIRFQAKRNLFERLNGTLDKSSAAVSNTIDFVQMEMKNFSPSNFLLSRDFLKIQIDEVLTLNVDIKDIYGHLDFELSGKTDVDDFVVPQMPVSIPMTCLAGGLSENKKKENVDGRVVANRASTSCERPLPKLLPKDDSGSYKQTAVVPKCKAKQKKTSKPEVVKNKPKRSIKPAKRQLPCSNSGPMDSTTPSTSSVMSSAFKRNKIHANSSAVHKRTDGDLSDKPSGK